MPSSYCNQRSIRFPFVLLFCLSISLLTLAQTNLAYQLLSGYSVSPEAPLRKGKVTLFVVTDADAFNGVFKPAPTTGGRSETPDFRRNMIIGIVTPATSKTPKLSISRVFVQDSTLTVRYIRLADTTKHPQTPATHPLLLFSIPKQTVLRTRLIENGKVVQTLKQLESAQN